jgi:hypothetical protein
VTDKKKYKNEIVRKKDEINKKKIFLTQLFAQLGFKIKYVKVVPM